MEIIGLTTSHLVLPFVSTLGWGSMTHLHCKCFRNIFVSVQGCANSLANQLAALQMHPISHWRSTSAWFCLPCSLKAGRLGTEHWLPASHRIMLSEVTLYKMCEMQWLPKNDKRQRTCRYATQAQKEARVKAITYTSL